MNEAGLRKTSKDLHVVVDDLIEQVAELDDLGDVQVRVTVEVLVDVIRELEDVWTSLVFEQTDLEVRANEAADV